jgi:hypothetical protein
VSSERYANATSWGGAWISNITHQNYADFFSRQIKNYKKERTMGGGTEDILLQLLFPVETIMRLSYAKRVEGSRMQ